MIENTAESFSSSSCGHFLFAFLGHDTMFCYRVFLALAFYIILILWIFYFRNLFHIFSY